MFPRRDAKLVLMADKRSRRSAEPVPSLGFSPADVRFAARWAILLI
jgi:hypothetical protein